MDLGENLWSVRQLDDADVAETQVRRRIVSLDADVPRFAAIADAGVVAGRADIGPIDPLDAVHPGREMIPVGGDGQREPFAVLRDLAPGRNSPIDCAGAEVDRVSRLAC